MPIILGLSTYKTPYKLYLEKLGEIDEQKETNFQYWGKVLEPIIRIEFEKRNKLKVETYDYPFIHETYDFIRGNIDGYIPEINAVLEIKTASNFIENKWGDPDTDQIPIPYLIQVAYYCMITKAEKAKIAVLIGGNDYREFEYIKNNLLETILLEKALEFWGFVKNKTPPPLINISDIKKFYCNSDIGKSKKANEYIYSYIDNLRRIKKVLKNLEEEEYKTKEFIMKYMEDSEYLTNEKNIPIVSWKQTKKGSRTFILKNND